MKAKGSGRRLPHRSVLSTVLVAGVLLPFLFIRAAFLALDAGAALCPSIGCLGWRFRPRVLWGSDASLELGKELRRAFADVEGVEAVDPKVLDAVPDSWDDLIREMATSQSNRYIDDINNFALRTKAMFVKMERNVQSARVQTSIYSHLASIGIPKSLHCLTLMLAEEYTVNALARASLPPPEFAYRLTNASHIHMALLTDNVLAAAVVVSSAVGSSANPEKIVFHIITDKKTYTAMHTWFSLHPALPATVEVKGLHQFDWPFHVNVMITEIVNEIRHGSVANFHRVGADDDYRRLQATKPSSFSLLNHLKVHLPDLFPKLVKVILLDDDVVVQRDLSPLWNLDLSGKVNGAVTEGGDAGDGGGCIDKELGYLLNFSNPLISAIGMMSHQCSWLGGMNVFDLQAWRSSNITERYHNWLKLNRESGFLLFGMGSFPPALIAFDGQVQPIDPSWHLPGLGWQMPQESAQLESAAVLHFSGPKKPWLEIGFPKLREMWRTHINYSDEFIRTCRVITT